MVDGSRCCGWISLSRDERVTFIARLAAQLSQRGQRKLSNVCGQLIGPEEALQLVARYQQ